MRPCAATAVWRPARVNEMKMGMDYKTLATRMAQATNPGGTGLGEHIAREVEELLLSRMDKASEAMLAPCLPHLARAVEQACPAVVWVAKGKLITGYGLPLKPGSIFLTALFIPVLAALAAGDGARMAGGIMSL